MVVMVVMAPSPTTSHDVLPRLMIAVVGTLAMAGGCAHHPVRRTVEKVRLGFSYCPAQRYGHAQLWLRLWTRSPYDRIPIPPAHFVRVRLRGNGVRHAYSSARTVVTNRRLARGGPRTELSRYRQRFDHPPHRVDSTTAFALLPVPAELDYRVTVSLRDADGDKTTLRTRFNAGSSTYAVTCGSS